MSILEIVLVGQCEVFVCKFIGPRTGYQFFKKNVDFSNTLSLKHLVRIVYWVIIKAMRVKVSPSLNTTSSALTFPCDIKGDHSLLFCSCLDIDSMKNHVNNFPLDLFFLSSK